MSEIGAMTGEGYPRGMESAVTALIHSSRFPGRARELYVASFRERRMNHQFHYDSEKQAQRWLAIHEAYSPARNDANCLNTYAEAFRDLNGIVRDEEILIISLGCGAGQKDLALLEKVRQARAYYPADVSLTLAMTAHLAIRNKFANMPGQPVVLDLGGTDDLAFLPGERPRLVAFFGMLPNFEPDQILPRLASLLRPNDFLLLSANLAPGADYAAGVRKVLPQYENGETRRWLATVLQDAGLEVDAADLEFRIVGGQSSLLRIEAGYKFRRPQTIRLDDQTFAYEEGDWFQLFFSYRHTPQILSELLRPHRIEITNQWITPSEEEGVFLCRRAT